MAVATAALGGYERHQRSRVDRSDSRTDAAEHENRVVDPCDGGHRIDAHAVVIEAVLGTGLVYLSKELRRQICSLELSGGKALEIVDHALELGDRDAILRIKLGWVAHCPCKRLPQRARYIGDRQRRRTR